jgi:hypothetical protein
MAAASDVFTVHVKNLAGGMIDIPDAIKYDTIYMIKDVIAFMLGKPYIDINRMVLTHMDNSAQGFTILQDDKALMDYNIDYENDILNLIINDAGGRRKKRATKRSTKRSTKRRLLKKRRTRRNYRKHY